MTHARLERIAIALALVLLSGMLACRTAPLPGVATIPVPPGLSSQHTEVAILAGILNTHPPENYDPTVTLPPDEFADLVWKGFLADARSRSWFPESREPGVVHAAVNTRHHLLRAAIRFDASTIRIEMLESQNLQQGQGRIHKTAHKWLSNLELRIRREVGRMAFLPAGGQ